MITDNFSQLKKSIDSASYRQIDRLNRRRDELLKETNAIENKCIDTIKTSKQNIFQECKDLIERNELIFIEW